MNICKNLDIFILIIHYKYIKITTYYYIMSLNEFTQNDNIRMLWDVISDEDIFRFLTIDIQEKIHQLFINNIQGFFESERTKKNSLVDLNKKYIILILNYIKKIYPYQPNKIKIYNEQPIKEKITYEEIQNDRKGQIEKEYTKRQEEFEDSMTIKAPPVPEFSDKKRDQPIKEIDKMVKEMLLQRNYEVEQINRSYNSSNNVNNWIKSQETSLKSKKINGINEMNEINGINGINDNSELNELSLSLSPKRNVSFSNNDEIKTFINEQSEEDNNLFSKLKKINNSKSQEDRITNLERNIDKLMVNVDKLMINVEKIFEILRS